MDKLEVLQQILSLNKYYAHAKPIPYKKTTAFRIVQSIKIGSAMPATEESFFKSYGYVVASPTQYKKS